MINFIKNLEVKNTVLIIFILIGCIFLFKEILFWHSYRAIKESVQFSLSNAQNQIKNGFERVSKSRNRLENEFHRKEDAFNNKFASLGKKTPDKPQEDEEWCKKQGEVLNDVFWDAIQMGRSTNGDDQPQKKLARLKEAFNKVWDTYFAFRDKCGVDDV